MNLFRKQRKVSSTPNATRWGMYDGKLHERDSKIVRTFLLLASVAMLSIYPLAHEFVNIIQISAGLALSAVLGWWIQPDLDHMGMTRVEYQAIKRGKLIGAFWVMFWTPYAVLIPHRSFLSHSIVGTFIRSAIVLFVFEWLPQLALESIFGLRIAAPWSFYLAFTAGLALHDAAHYVRDGYDPLGLVKVKKWKQQRL